MPCRADGRAGPLHSEHDSCRIACGNAVGWDVRPHDGTGGNDASFTNFDAGKDDAFNADPNAIPDGNRTDILVGGGASCQVIVGVNSMSIGVHDPVIGRNHTVASDRDTLSDDERAIMAYATIVADFQNRPVSKSGSKGDGNLAIDYYVIADDDVPLAGDPVDKATGSKMAAVGFTISLKKRFADEYAKEKVISVSDAKIYPEDGLGNDMWRGEAEIAHSSITPPSKSRQSGIADGQIALEAHASSGRQRLFIAGDGG
jgi:hypothetical protein